MSPLSRILAAAALSTTLILAQSHPVKEAPPNANDDELTIRHDNPNVPCRFAPIYAKIKQNKNDPRVAFLELADYVDPGSDMKFKDRCRQLTNQNEEYEAFFDKAHAFLLITLGAGPGADESLAFFAGVSPKPGIMLYSSRTEFKHFVFVYRDQKWQDATKHYLAAFNLGPNDHIIVPQYGRTARVLTYDANAPAHFQHKLWLHWTGTKFEPQTEKPKDWRCPDAYTPKLFDPTDLQAFCR